MGSDAGVRVSRSHRQENAVENALNAKSDMLRFSSKKRKCYLLSEEQANAILTKIYFFLVRDV